MRRWGLLPAHAEEMVDRGMPVGPKYVAIEQLADQAKSIRPAAKHVKAMK